MPAVVKGGLILVKEGVRHSEVYREVLELLGRFGYASIDEVRYGLDLDQTKAWNRLWYLEHIGLIEQFKSHSVPASFYCLTPKGRQAARHFKVSDEVSAFTPCAYQPVSQQHHRSIIKVHLGLRKLLGDRFLGWTTERTLKAEQEARMALGNGKRILDGELFLNVKKTRYKAIGRGEMTPTGEFSFEKWRCGIEVELSLKSPERYRKQFKDLAGRVYDSLSKEQYYPMLIFFYTTPTLRDCLASHLKSGRYAFGDCVFYLAQIDEFLERLSEAPAEKFVGSQTKILTTSEISEVKWVVTQ